MALGLKSNAAPFGAECVERFTSHYAPKGAEEHLGSREVYKHLTPPG